MTTQSNYEASQDLNKYEMLMNTKEILTQEEYDFCFNWDHVETRQSTSNLGERGYLNLNVYSEADHHESVQRRERGY
jgi:hypothetical protein